MKISIVLIAVAISAASLTANANPFLEWDAPTPMDGRIEHYAIHCADAGVTVPVDGSAELVRVDKDTLTADLAGKLEAGKDYDCVATSESESHGLSSDPSNTARISLAPLPSPGNFRVKITITIENL